MSDMNPVAPSNHLLAPPAEGEVVQGYVSDARVRAPDEMLSGARERKDGEVFITDKFVTGPALGQEPAAPTAAPDSNRPADEPTVRHQPTATDHLASAVQNTGNLLEDLWDNRYGEAVQDAGQAAMDAGSAIFEAFFGDEKKPDAP